MATFQYGNIQETGGDGLGGMSIREHVESALEQEDIMPVVSSQCAAFIVSLSQPCLSLWCSPCGAMGATIPVR